MEKMREIFEEEEPKQRQRLFFVRFREKCTWQTKIHENYRYRYITTGKSLTGKRLL